MFLGFLISLCAILPFLVIAKHVLDFFRDSKGLRRFPPMSTFSSLTNIPCMIEAMKGQRFKAFHDAHQRLGPVIRVGPNSISFNDAKAVKDIYGHGSPVRKGDFYDLLAGSHRHLADVSDREDHSRKRRVLAGAYSQASLENWEYIVADRTAALLKQYDRLCERPECIPTLHGDSGCEISNGKSAKFINHRYWMILFAQDAILQIGITADLNFLESGSDIVTTQSMDGKSHTFRYRDVLWRSHLIQNALVWSPGWFKWLSTLTAWHPYWNDGNVYNTMCVDLVHRRLARYIKGEKLDDFFTYILEDKYGNPNMHELGEMVAECSIMLNAGSDTTGIALTNVLYWLLKNPICLEKLRDELDDIFEEEMTVAAYDRVKHLPYLRACLDESMRLTPPNTMSVNRLTPAEGMSIMGYWIPGNTTVHSPPYSMHRDPEVFPDPESFNPDRWLGEKGKDLQAHFITFSAGARGCIGRNITYLEQTVALASMVHRYEFALPHENWVLGQKEAFTLLSSGYAYTNPETSILGNLTYQQFTDLESYSIANFSLFRIKGPW
ncbi:benzoate 4-monooxygenase cytochrome p450 [Penicillium herquei]|nr:benzoate 4-monooxygenase cytochrome p450 [Penicillium herquei]